MKTKLFLLLVIFLITGITSIAFQEKQDHKVLFEKAKYTMETKGDLKEAITLFESLIKTYPNEKEYVAKALLYEGMCYEKLGNLKARQYYENVINNYSDQPELVQLAQKRLNRLLKAEKLASKELPEGLSVVNLGGWDKPGMAFEPFEISPDGAMGVGVEFIKGQNIIVYNLKTKQVKYVTNHTWDLVKGYCWTYHPVLSPNGKEVVYFSSCVYNEGPDENSLTVTTLDGRSRVLAKDENDWYIPNAWLPDGSAILTIKGSPDNAPQLGLFPKNGGKFKALVTLQKKKQGLGKTYATASVSPDGRYILFTDASPGEKNDIYIMSSNGDNPKPLIKHPAADKSPRWSPDGKNIVFLSLRHGSWALWGVDFKDGKAVGEPFLIRDGMKDAYLLNWTNNGLACWNWVTIYDIFNMDMDPTTGEPIGEPTQLKYTPTGGNVYPAWSPDGKSFAFLSANDNAGSSSIVVVGNSTREFPVPKEYGGRGYLRWTPDGSAIGMLGVNKKEELFIYRLSLDSGKWGSTPLSVPGWTPFEWSDNGKAILFTKNGTTGNGAGIIELTLESGKERYVYRPDQDTSAIYIRSLRVSRDFKQLAFLENNEDLMVVDLETEENYRVAANKGNVSWSPDGKKILSDRAYATEGSKQSLIILSVAGDSQKVIDLSKSLPKKMQIRTPDWSPDGKKIVFTLRSQKSEVLLFQNVIPNEK